MENNVEFAVYIYKILVTFIGIGAFLIGYFLGSRNKKD
jgi:hypothetical protein